MAITGSVFKNPYDQHAQVWTAQGAAIYIGEGDSDPTKDTSSVLGAISGVQITFQRQVTTKYPLGIKDKPIHIVGAPVGTITLQSIIGPSTNVQNFLAKFGNVCKPFSIGISNLNRKSSLDCGKKIAEQKIKCYGCIGQTLQYQLTQEGQGMIMANGTFQVKFTQMTWE